MSGERFYDTHSQSLADFFIQGLEDGTSRYVKPWAGGDIPPLSYNPVSGVAYQGGNQFALNMAETRMELQDWNPYSDRRWMTYKQALSVGAQVQKGAKGTHLAAWKEVFERPKDRQEPPTEEAKKRLICLPFTVFHATQIDGLPPPQVFEARPLDERLADAQKIVDDLGVPMLSGASYAAYIPSKDRIMMPDREAFTSDAAYMAVLLHESAHATGHSSRLDRKFGFDRKSEEYAREELRAEMSSFEMCRRLGVDYEPSQHVAYVNSWISLLKKDPKEIMRAASDCERILKFLNVPELVYEKIPQIEQKQETEKALEPAKPARANARSRSMARPRAKAHGMKHELTL